MKRTIVFILRVMAIVTALLPFLGFYDFIMPPTEEDYALVTSKYEIPGSERNWMVRAKGRYNYDEDVSSVFYNKVSVGNKLHIKLSKFYKEWKQVDIIVNDKVVATGKGMDFYLLIFNLIFFLPLIFLFKINFDKTFDYEDRYEKFYSPEVIISVILEFAALVLWIRLFLKWFGVIAKT